MKQYKQANRQNALYLRQNMTKAERMLWFNYLVGYKPRFNKQRLLGSYIVDFYCSKARLVIELDGGQHYDEGDNEAYDKKRTDYLDSQGITVVRFTNTDVLSNLAGVCHEIDCVVKKQLAQRFNPPD